MRHTAFFITHPDVAIDPTVPVPQWPLSERGLARMRVAATRPWASFVRRIVASRERKAIDAAEILAAALGLEFTTMADLGENDRGATGFLPQAEFEGVADIFFGRPDESVRGWERAVDAQRRIVGAFDAVLALPRADGDIAIVSHGAVGALLIAALEGRPISRAEDQPPGQGGYYFAIDVPSRLLRHGWTLIDT